MIWGHKKKPGNTDLPQRVDVSDLERDLSKLSVENICAILKELREHDPTATMVLRPSGPKLYLRPGYESAAAKWLRSKLDQPK